MCFVKIEEVIISIKETIYEKQLKILMSDK